MPSNHRATAVAALIAIAATTSACGDDDATNDADAVALTTGPTTDAVAGSAVTEPDPPPTTAVADPVTTAAATTPSTVIDDKWRQAVAAGCAAYAAALPTLPAPDAVGAADWVATWRGLHDSIPWFGDVDYPPELRTAPFDVPAVAERADAVLAEAERAAAAGDDTLAFDSTDLYGALLQYGAGMVTVHGAECGDPARAAGAALNVPVFGTHQVAVGFGSVWASPQARGTSITRIDAQTGEILATIDVGAAAFRSQPADGRMIVRTADAYVAIDPTTNTVVATLPKPDVGPAADRQWAVDGALWICDGQRLHRYDPATLTPTGTVIELGIDCGFVYATAELVVAWNYNEDPGQSGNAAAVFVDPADDTVLATVDLPADPIMPVVLDDAVYFPASFGTLNAVVDRATWTVVATPDYGRDIGNHSASDGRSIYLIADDVDVLVVDARTYEVTGVIEPLTIIDHLNGLAVGPGALWVATGDAGIVQRFDIP